MESLSASTITPSCHLTGQDPSARWVSLRNPYAFSAASHWPATDRPIADSTWSHGSVCPPVNHGISPFGRCTEAIHSPVARAASASSTPGTLGTGRERSTPLFMVRTNDQASAGLRR